MRLVGLPPQPVKALPHVAGDVGDGEWVALLSTDLDAGVPEAVKPHEQGGDEHGKGPDDKPLLVREKVITWRR